MFIFSVYLLLNDAQHPHEFQVKTGINRLIFNMSPIIILLFDFSLHIPFIQFLFVCFFVLNQKFIKLSKSGF